MSRGTQWRGETEVSPGRTRAEVLRSPEHRQADRHRRSATSGHDRHGVHSRSVCVSTQWHRPVIKYGGVRVSRVKPSNCIRLHPTSMISKHSLKLKQWNSYWRPSLSIGLAVLSFYSKTGFWPSYCRISTDLDKIVHTPIVVRNTRVGRLRSRSARGWLQAKPESLMIL